MAINSRLYCPDLEIKCLLNVCSVQVFHLIKLDGTHLNIVYADHVLVVGVGGEPRYDSLGAGDATGSDTCWSHVGRISANHHSAGRIS